MDLWRTFLIKFTGGLISNLSRLQQGMDMPGSARIIRNFEPSTEGGYRRILGYAKYDANFIPPYGEPVVQGSGQTGTTLVIANVYTTPRAGDTFTIDGVTGTYTIDAAGVTYDSTSKRATLTLTSALASSPADKAAITFSNTTDLIRGVYYFGSTTIAQRNSDIWKSSGAGWTRINKPSYGTVLVNTGSQTGTSLLVDGLDANPMAGDTFTIDGVELVYTVTADVTTSSGAATLSISPALASSPADNAAITFLSTDRSGVTDKVKFLTYNFSGTDMLSMVDGTNNPVYYDGTTFTVFPSTTATEVIGATALEEYKKHLFFAKGNTLSFTVPFTDADFTIANGAGKIIVPSPITSLIRYRNQLIIFCEQDIFVLVGDDASTFALQPITRDLGCTNGDTVQEIGGDVIFLAHDGLRLLSATDRINDFGLAAITRPIQSTFVEFQGQSNSYTSCVIRKKSQYRIFGYNANFSDAAARGFMAVQMSLQGEGFQFAETRGFNAYVAASVYTSSVEIELFANTSGYVYQMESGNDMDGGNINATYATPFMPFEDPRIRKTYYKAQLYLEPLGSVTLTQKHLLNFDGDGTIQPDAITLTNITSSVSFYGVAVYGVATYGEKLQYVFNTPIVGSGFDVSFEYNYEGTDPPFILDSLTIEYATADRR